jgi:hypothetical protein
MFPWLRCKDGSIHLRSVLSNVYVLGFRTLSSEDRNRCTFGKFAFCSECWKKDKLQKHRTISRFTYVPKMPHLVPRNKQNKKEATFLVIRIKGTPPHRNTFKTSFNIILTTIRGLTNGFFPSGFITCQFFHQMIPRDLTILIIFR